MTVPWGVSGLCELQAESGQMRANNVFSGWGLDEVIKVRFLR